MSLLVRGSAFIRNMGLLFAKCLGRSVGKINSDGIPILASFTELSLDGASTMIRFEISVAGAFAFLQRATNANATWFLQGRCS